MLDIEQRTYYCLNYRDINKIVEEHFGIKYNCLESLDGNFKNDMYDVYYVPDLYSDWADEWNKETWDKWHAGDIGDNEYHPENQPHLANMLDRLAAEEVIPTGKYLIEISW